MVVVVVVGGGVGGNGRLQWWRDVNSSATSRLMERFSGVGACVTIVFDRCNQSFFGPWQSHFPRPLSIVTDSTRYVRDRPIRRANRIYFTLCLKTPGNAGRWTPSVERSATNGAETTVLSRSGSCHWDYIESQIANIDHRRDSTMRRNWTGDTVRLPHQKQIITNERPRVASTSRVPGLRFAINTHRLPSTNCIMPRGSCREYADQA